MTTDINQQKSEEKAQMLECALPAGTILRGKSGREYKITDVLGAGGFGITYKAMSIVKVNEHFSVPAYFAIKEHFVKGCYRSTDKSGVLYSASIKHDVEQSRKDFEKEARVLMTLNGESSHIVKVNELFESNGTCYYVMEFLDGKSLQRYMDDYGKTNSRRGLSEEKALSLLVPVASAVGMLHRHELLHLDIKPDNIMLKTDPVRGTVTPVLIDFGLAKHFDKKGNPTSHLTAKGATAGYAPMEQFAEIDQFSPEIDVYALGATLFFLLTGMTPPNAFNVKSSASLMEKLPADVSPRVRKALEGAMQPSKFERTRTVDEFITTLEGKKEAPGRKPLPAGHVLHGQKTNYLIMELTDSTPDMFIYRAMPVNSLNGTPAHMGGSNATQVNTAYYVYEWCIRNADVRQADSSLAPQSFRDKANSPQALAFAREMSERIPEAAFSEYDAYGHPKAEKFEANGTRYYSCRIMPKSPWFADIVKNYRNYIVAGAIGCVVAIGGYAGYTWYKNLPQPAPSEVQTAPVAEADKSEEIRVEEKTKPVTSAEKPAVKEPAVEEEKEQPASAPKTKTNDELFAEARTLSDYKTLADKGYAKAYYPLANLYYNNNNYAQAKTWANKSVSAGINLSAARKLLQRITELEQADRYAAALIGNDWNTIRQMADSGYKAAYAKLATHYLQANDYDNADKYAQKACAAGTDKDDAKKVMLALKGYGYYDDKKLPEWIK